MAQILPLPGVKAPAQTVAHFVRLGDTGHRQLADLHAEGRFAPRRVVADASRLHHQKELVQALATTGAQIVLDTKAAELSAAAKFAGFARGAPWAARGDGKPLGEKHFDANSPDNVLRQIAEFAVANGVHTVLAPGHFLIGGSKSTWFGIDRRACAELRKELDRAGGKQIGLDYSLLLPHVALDQVEERGGLVEGLKDLPFDNLWIRASGFGADARPLSARRYVNSLAAMHNLGKPIVADYLGGLISLASVSFGVISGFAEGIGERERFDAREWHKIPKVKDEDEEFGRAKRVAIADFGRSVTANELKILCEARGGRRLVACNDRACCPHGMADMLANPKRHAVYQRMKQVEGIEKVPDLNRTQHFLDGEMARADRLSRQIKELKTNDEKLSRRMAQHSERMEKLRATLEHFYGVRGNDVPRALPVIETKKSNENRGAR